MPNDPHDNTIPSRMAAPRPAAASAPAIPPRRPGESDPPAWLVAAMNGENDLDHDWAARYAGMPLLTLFHTARSGAFAMLTTQDGAAGLTVSSDAARQPSFTYTWGGMIGLRFSPARLTDSDRARWVELMRQPTPEPIFLWGQSRWESDFLICVAHRHYLNVYAYGQGREAGIRMTLETAARWVTWLAGRWA